MCRRGDTARRGQLEPNDDWPRWSRLFGPRRELLDEIETPLRRRVLSLFRHMSPNLEISRFSLEPQLLAAELHEVGRMGAHDAGQ
jgi:hypothetical protein